MYQQGPFNIPPYGPNFKIPLQGPLPLGQAVKQLFKQYVRVFTSPSRATFAQELSKAAWNIVWVQLISLAILVLLPSIILFDLIIPTLLVIFLGNKAEAGLYGTLGLLSVAISLSPLLLVPLSFFSGLFIQYLVAKMLGGKGTLVQHGYALALINTPAQLLTFLIALLPVLGEVALLALLIYGIVLRILMVMAVHRIEGVRAAIVVFSPLIAAIVLATAVYLYAILFAFHN